MLPDRGRIDPSSWPLYPPERYFDLPDQLPDDVYAHVVLDGPDAGRVYGWVHHAGTMLLGSPGGPFTPDPSPSGLHDCQLGQTPTNEGGIVRTANVGGGVNHAPVTSGYHEAVKHYENTASQTMRIRYHYVDTPNGKTLAYSGALWPDLTERDVLTVLGSGLSGDWRYRPEYSAYDFCGSQLVSNPGLPLRRVAGAGDADHPAIVGPGACEGESCAVCDTPVLTSGARLDDIEQALGEFAVHLGYEILPARTAAICEPLDIDSRIAECEDALDALVRTAANDNHDELGRFAEGSVSTVDAAINDYSITGAVARETRLNAEAHDRDGTPLDPRTAAIIEAIESAPPLDQTLYRGTMALGTTPEDIVAANQPGSDVRLPLASTSSDYDAGRRFAGDNGSTRVTPVMYEIEPGAQGHVIDYSKNDSPFADEKEVLVRGDFTIKSAVVQEIAPRVGDSGTSAKTGVVITLTPKAKA